MSKEDILRTKFDYLKKLELLASRGIELTKTYTIESSLMEMKAEYDAIVATRKKQNAIQFQRKCMSMVISGIELMNKTWDPFDLQLDGLGEAVNENISNFDDPFEELYDMYKESVTSHPALDILIQLGGMGVMVHMSNSMLKSAPPGMDAIFRQNPDLMREFQKAAVKTVGSSVSSGMGNIMSHAMDRQEQRQQSQQEALPPRYVERTQPPPPSYAQAQDQGRAYHIQPKVQQQQQSQPQMRGPSVDLFGANSSHNNNSSTISVEDAQELRNVGAVPRPVRRRPKSDKNIVSMDI
jgi:hypothetical protein